MSGKHRAELETGKARVAVAGALSAGALLLAPVGVALATPGLAHAAVDPGSGGNPGTPPPPPPGDGGTPGGGSTGCNHVFHLPSLKSFITHIEGQAPRFKFGPF